MATEGFTGMAELIADLGRMGHDVERDAGGIVLRTADAMANDVIGGYPVKEGGLRAGVVVEKSAASPTRVKVRSKSPHAHLFENGTVQRHTAGTGANRGTMPAKPTFVPAAVRARRRMTEELVGLVRRQKVRGMTGTLEVREA